MKQRQIDEHENFSSCGGTPHGINAGGVLVAEVAWKPVKAPPETILQEAQRLVHGDRGDAYGHPIDDFTRTGRMWAAILDVEKVTPVQVGLCMAAMKMSRQCNKPKRDNMTDLAGYAETVQMVVDRERELENDK